VQTNVRIDEIHVKKRIRKNLGELTPLMNSLKVHGLLNPIILSEKKELIAGERRLESAKRLGWKTIPAIILEDTTDLQKLELEIEENLHRRNLTRDELADGYDRIDRLRHPGFFRRLWRKIVAFFKKLFGR
jgi:ParB family chromosome partitioning protein